MCKVVLFYHPSGEHLTDSNGCFKKAECLKSREMLWNSGTHRRKFIKARGLSIDNLTTTSPVESDLYFWGEWEPESVIKPINTSLSDEDAKKNDIPKYIHEPIIYKREKGNFNSLACTDPYVLGSSFRYCCCQQKNKNGTLRKLRHGDIIIFCGKRKGKLLIDTVFVVDKAIEYSGSNYRSVLNDYISDVYMQAAIMPIFGSNENCGSACSSKNDKNGCINICTDDNKNFTFYTAVMYGSDCASKTGIFSYFPCKTGDAGKQGFSRFEVNATDFGFTFTQHQGFKTNNVLKAGENTVKYWHRLTATVLNAGYRLGTYANEPEFKI